MLFYYCVNSIITEEVSLPSDFVNMSHIFIDSMGGSIRLNLFLCRVVSVSIICSLISVDWVNLLTVIVLSNES